MSFDLSHYLQAKQALVDARLQEVFTAEPGIPTPLREAMRYSLLAPGKRLRPCLVFMACEAAGGTRRTGLACRLRGRNDPYLFAHPRRSARHGR